MRSKRTPTPLLLFLIVLFASSAAGAEGLVEGAAAFVRQVLERAQGKESSDPKEITALQREIEQFPTVAQKLPPAETAREWLKLVDRTQSLSPGARTGMRGMFESYGNTDRLLLVLPPPAAWPELARAVKSRPAGEGEKARAETGLRLLSATLTGDRSARIAAIGQLQKIEAQRKESSRGSRFSMLQNQLDRALVQNTEDPEELVRLIEPQLQLTSDSALELPDLLTILGPERAEKFLRRALVESPRLLAFSRAEESARLARQLALELVGKLKAPQWKLACALEAAPLYEALRKRFGDAPAERNDMYSYSDQVSALREARTYYFLSLIASERVDDAIKMATLVDNPPSGRYSPPRANIGLSDEAIEAMERAGYGRALTAFLHKLLDAHPELRFWENYVQLAAKAGETEQMLALARTVAARPDFTGKKATDFRLNYYKALLAADQVEEGVGEMRKLLASSGSEDDEGPSAELGLKLARLGQLLERKDWIEEGLAAADRGARNDIDVDRALKQAWLLSELGRGGKAERRLADELGKVERRASGSRYASFYERERTRKLLGELALIYQQSGRPEEVLKLFQTASWWGAADLAEFYASEVEIDHISEFSSHAPAAEVTYGYLAAAAFAARGDQPAARKLLDAVLDRSGNLDPAYELLLQLGGDDLGARLDALFARDQFEERPLIWKAVLLLQKKNLDEAEKTIRQAIAIDPSDGEQGPGRRMRAYSVLADILEARGDQKGAAENRAAVTAIRLSEKADRFYEAGLLTRAVQMYRDALDHFENAYCIQSRLALREAELGHNDAAEAHYRKAFELMPDSFGRVESHCFGCERAFSGKRAESIANKVFLQLVSARPEKPQVHYLLGYLRDEEGRYREALPEFQEAVRLDPEYLNAWKNIDWLGRRMGLPAAQRDAATINVVRLDPLGRHSSPNFGDTTDLRAIWNAVEAADAKRALVPEKLLALPASKAALETSGRAAEQGSSRYLPEAERNGRSPAEAVAENKFIDLASQLFGWQSVLREP